MLVAISCCSVKDSKFLISVLDILVYIQEIWWSSDIMNEVRMVIINKFLFFS